ncbi:MAG: hypothetical protein LUC43_08075 [Burkholderiales bacterium]|nr:hypothetical protein [Burkholderiales bacterium]
MTVLIHDGSILGSISYWGTKLNDVTINSDKKLRNTEHAYYIPGLDESGKPIEVDVRHIFKDGYHDYMVLRQPEQKFFFEGRRLPFFSCVVEDDGPRGMLTDCVHQCQVWKDPLFQRNCRGFATKFMFKLLDQNKVITGDFSQTWDGMNLWLNFMQYAVNSGNYNCFYAIADRKFDKDGKEIPLKRYLIKVETLADVFGHYCQHIMGDDRVYVYRIAGATVKDKSLESIIANPSNTEILTCQEAEEKGVFNIPQAFEDWPMEDSKKFTNLYIDFQ